MSRMTRKSWLALGTVALTAALSLSACGGSNQITPATSAPRTETTRHGHFVVSYTPSTKMALNELQTWLVHVETAGGTPVSDATLRVSGGMPDMGHALPTDPLVSGKPRAGDYRVEGLQFSMPGAWVVTVDVTASGVTDQASFKLYIQ